MSGRYSSQNWLELFPKIFNIFFGIKSQYVTGLNLANSWSRVI